MKDKERLETPRLLLDRPGMGDVAAIVRLANDLAVARMLARMPHPYRPADARAFITDIVPHEDVRTVRLKADGALAGMIGLAPGADGGPPELGYWYGRAFWGQGIATEAGHAVIAHQTCALGVTRIIAGCFAANAASERVLTKLGFVQTGRSLRRARALGRDLPHVDMVLDCAGG